MARTQFKVTFTNAQPGAPVSVLTPSVEHIYSTATAVQPVGGKQLYLDATNSITVWSDAQDVITQTVDGAGLFIQGTATVASPTVTVGDGTAPVNPAGSAASSATEGGTWATGTVYAQGVVVTAFGERYQATAAHTAAAAFSTDYATGKWLPLGTPDMIGGGRRGGLMTFRHALGLARAAQKNMKILLLGDSTTQGVITETSTQSWPDAWPTRLVQMMTAYPGVVNNRGFQNVWATGVDAVNWTVPSGWTTSGVANTGIRANSAPVGPIVSASLNCAGFNLYGWRNVGTTGLGSYQLDGGGAVTIDETAGPNGLFKVSIPASPGNHTLTINYTSGIFALPYIEVIPASTGTVHAFNAGGAGYVVSTYQTDSSPAGLNNGGVFNSILGWDAVVVNLSGINEWQANTAVATFQTNLAALIATIQGIGALPILAIEIPPPSPTSAHTFPWSQYVAATYAVANASSLPLIDCTPRYVDRATMVVAGHPNQVHGDRATYADFAAFIAQSLFA